MDMIMAMTAFAFGAAVPAPLTAYAKTPPATARGYINSCQSGRNRPANCFYNPAAAGAWRASTGYGLAALVMFVTLFGAPAYAQRVSVKSVAITETEVDAQSGADREISIAEVREITTEIRRVAVNILPSDRFNVMTSETVLAMGGAVLAECAEENCVIALGSKIGADYIVRGMISKFGRNLTLSVEMFETEYGMLVASASSVRTASIEELLEKGSAACAEMYRIFLRRGNQAAQQPPPAPQPPGTYTLRVNSNPGNGGKIECIPDQPYYNAGTKVTVIAIPIGNYKFTGWAGGSSKDTMRIIMNNNRRMTANFKQADAKKKNR